MKHWGGVSREDLRHRSVKAVFHLRPGRICLWCVCGSQRGGGDWLLRPTTETAAVQTEVEIICNKHSRSDNRLELASWRPAARDSWRVSAHFIPTIDTEDWWALVSLPCVDPAGWFCVVLLWTSISPRRWLEERVCVSTDECCITQCRRRLGGTRIFLSSGVTCPEPTQMSVAVFPSADVLSQRFPLRQSRSVFFIILSSSFLLSFSHNQRHPVFMFDESHAAWEDGDAADELCSAHQYKGFTFT